MHEYLNTPVPNNRISINCMALWWFLHLNRTAVPLWIYIQEVWPDRIQVPPISIWWQLDKKENISKDLHFVIWYKNKWIIQHETWKERKVGRCRDLEYFSGMVEPPPLTPPALPPSTHTHTISRSKISPFDIFISKWPSQGWIRRSCNSGISWITLCDRR